MRNIVYLLTALGLAAGCSSSDNTSDTSRKPSHFVMEVPGSAARGGPQFLSARISGTNTSGTITAAFVTLSYLASKPYGNPPRFPVDGATSAALLTATQTGTGAGMVTQFAMTLARTTYCRTGPIAKQQGVRRISNPNDIAKIVDASRRNNGRDTIPAGVKGVAVDATRYDASFGTPEWTVSLTCDAPNPYG